MFKAITITIILTCMSLPTYAQLNDPTKPPNYNGVAVQPFQLSTILISPTRRVAVINGKFVKIGDKLQGAEIKKIQPNLVTLKKNGKILKLNLVQSVKHKDN